MKLFIKFFFYMEKIRGDVSMGYGMIGGLIALAIGVIVLANVFISTVKNTDTTNWSAGEVALWGTLTIVAISGMLMAILGVFNIG